MIVYADVEKLGSRVHAYAETLIAEKADRFLVLTEKLSDTIRGIGQHFTGLTTVQLNTNKTLRALRFANLFDLVRFPIKVIKSVKLTITAIKVGSISETVIRGSQIALSVVSSLNAALFVPFAAIPLIEKLTTNKVMYQAYLVLGKVAVGFGVILSTVSAFVDGLKVSKGLYLAYHLQKAKTDQDKLAHFLSYLDIDLDKAIEKSQSRSLISSDRADREHVTESDKERIRELLGEDYSADQFWTAVDSVSKARKKAEFDARIALGTKGRDLLLELKAGKKMPASNAVAILTHELKRRLLRRSILMTVSLLGLASTIMLLISAAPIPTLIATGIWLLSTAVGLYFSATGWIKSEQKEGDGAGYKVVLLSAVVFIATMAAAFVLTTTPAGYVGVVLLCLIWMAIMGYTLYSIKHKRKEPDVFGRIS